VARDVRQESRPVAAAAAAADIAALYAEAEESLRGIGFLKPATAARAARELRALLGRAEPTAREVRMLRGVCRRVRGRARRG
jgi:tRNA C32,U32 (ribose-2'-O)-methylase TrmJ